MKKRKIISGFIVLTLFWCILSFFTLNSKDVTTSQIRVVKEGNRATQVGEAVEVGEISKGKYVQQDFEALCDNLYGFTLEFSDYDRSNNLGVVNVRLESINNHKVIMNSSFLASEIKDGEKRSFIFDKQPHSKGRKYRIKITSNSPDGKAISLYVSRMTNLEDIALKTNISHLKLMNERDYNFAKKEIESKGDKLTSKNYEYSYIFNMNVFYKKNEKSSFLFINRFVFIIISYLMLIFIIYNINRKRGLVDGKNS